MTITTFFAMAAAFAQCAAPGKALPPDLASLVKAEGAFAHASVSKGMRVAFLTYLADDAVVFRPEPVAGKKWYRSRPQGPAILAWEPEFADVSTSNDLGYTTGPWALRPDSLTAPGAFGHYVSVWRRGADREWEVAIDVSVTHGRVERPQSLATPTSEKPGDVITQQEALAGVQQEERDFIEAAARGVEDAFDTFASDDVRTFREGEFPAIGRDKARVLLAKRSGTHTMKTTATEVSRDGDLAFTYGRCDITRDEKTSTSYYLRIWKRMADGSWKIIVDLDNPVPATE
jgi:ketosteroid isomerase-like protein